MINSFYKEYKKCKDKNPKIYYLSEEVKFIEGEISYKTFSVKEDLFNDFVDNKNGFGLHTFLHMMNKDLEDRVFIKNGDIKILKVGRLIFKTKNEATKKADKLNNTIKQYLK